MDIPSLELLFNPRSVAVIGASRSASKPGGIILRRLAHSGRRVLPVHPTEEELIGLKVYHRITELPPEVDLAVISIAAEGAVDAAKACAAHGIPYLIVIAGGFSEAGADGRALEDELTAITRQFSTRILGPNSLGVFIPEHRLDTIFVEHGDKSLAAGGGITFISQSGSVGVESLGLASNSGYGMRAFVGLGNKCDLTELEFLRYFGEDDGCNCLAFYIENLSAGREFLAGAESVTRKKPVLVLKAGRTSAGAQAVASHTGRLAGSDRVVTGAFSQFGIQRVYDDEELCDASKALSALPPARGNRIAVLTPAGGYGVLCADYVESDRRPPHLLMARLSDETQDRILQSSVPYAATTNPVDLTAGADNHMTAAALEILAGDPGVDIVICIALFSPPAINDELIDEFAGICRASDKPIVFFTQYGPFTDSYLKHMYSLGLIGFPSISRTVRAVRALVERSIIIRRGGGGT